MIFGQDERFKSTHAKALCACKCVEYWSTKKFGSLKGPKIVPDSHPKRDELDDRPILSPNINPVRPRSATCSLKQSAHRFGFMEPGRDSPGPNRYKLGGIFDNTYRLRNRTFHTFGAGTRWESKKDEGGLVVTDPLTAYKYTALRSPGAVLLGRHNGYIKDDNPGPGTYAVKRDLAHKGPMMRPDYFDHDKPVKRPGYLYLSVPLLKKSHSHANFGTHTGVCMHSENHNYCCRNCCKLCGKSIPVRTMINTPEWGNSQRRPKSASATRRTRTPSTTYSPHPSSSRTPGGPAPESAFDGSQEEGFDQQQQAPVRNRPSSAPAVRRAKPTSSTNH